jgi:hypothetical protein
VCHLLKFLLIALLILFIIILLFIIGIKNRRQAIQTYSFPTFIGKSSYNLIVEEPNEQKKSLIDKIIDIFNDSTGEIIDNDGDGDIGDGGDGWRIGTIHYKFFY